MCTVCAWFIIHEAALIKGNINGIKGLINGVLMNN